LAFFEPFRPRLALKTEDNMPAGKLKDKNLKNLFFCILKVTEGRLKASPVA
jgi:hypothetical protein